MGSDCILWVAANPACSSRRVAEMAATTATVVAAAT
jgi:hypothetical protein